MKHQDLAAGLLTAAVALLTSADALAAPPRMCRSGDGRRGYDQGYQLQARSLRNSFDRNFSCGSVESFIQAVGIEFPEAASSDRFLQCRDIGIMDGQNETIRDIAQSCQMKCSDSGDRIGTLAARQYCRIQEIIGAQGEGVVVTAPLPTCEIATEQACRSAFAGFVNAHAECSAAAGRDAAFTRAMDDACAVLR